MFSHCMASTSIGLLKAMASRSIQFCICQHDRSCNTTIFGVCAICNMGIIPKPWMSNKPLNKRNREFCQIGDAMVAQDHKGAQELLAVTLVAVEQASMDGGKWDLAYLLSLPPQSIYTSRTSSTNPRLRSFAPLCPQPWATTALAYVKEQDVIARHQEQRKEEHPARTSHGTENQPRRTRFPKKPKKGGGDKAGQ